MKHRAWLSLGVFVVVSIASRVIAAPTPLHSRGQVPWINAKDTILPSWVKAAPSVGRESGPIDAQKQAQLELFQIEVREYEQSSTMYQQSARALLERKYLFDRNQRDQIYAKRINHEEVRVDKMRTGSIANLEAFLRRHGDNPAYAPDVMFKLGELYFEDSEIAFNQAKDSEAETQAADAPSDTPDYSRTIELYRQIAARFPDYEQLDGVYYLLGYCLNEMGRPNEAIAAWLEVTCTNKSPDYANCEPINRDPRFVSDTWFRIGEYHFDEYGDRAALNKAISAYSQILRNKDDKNFGLALYKIAWTFYRANDYRRALHEFIKLVDWSDEIQKAGGTNTSDLRPEALEYIAIILAYDDWNENQVADNQENLPSGVDKVQAAGFLPQDRAWTFDVYRQLGQLYFEEAKYNEAIAVWRLAIPRWPLNEKTPDLIASVAQAYEFNRDYEKAIEVRAELLNYRIGSAWWNANAGNPTQQARVQRMAENSLSVSAIYHHSQAQKLRRSCTASKDPVPCADAQKHYQMAADAYRSFLNKYPESQLAYELYYNMADALFWSGNYEQAATEYAVIRDLPGEGKFEADAARRVVESLYKLIETQGDRTWLDINAPSTASDAGQVQQPRPMPELLQRTAKARDLYIERVAKHQDKENLLAAYSYNNALLLYQYGYWSLARSELDQIYEQRCDGEGADVSGTRAWETMRAMAIARDDREEIRRLATDMQKRQCTAVTQGKAVDCRRSENAENAMCLAKADLNALIYRDALDIYARAQHTKGAEQVALYENSATLLVDAVNANPADKQAPIALEYAALALEGTQRYDAAAKLYARIIDEVGPKKADTPEEQEKLDQILSNAYFRLGNAANQSFDFERALDNYRVLAESPRFVQSAAPQIKERRADALINAAIISDRLQRYKIAQSFYLRAYREVPDAEERRTALFRIAEMDFERGAYREAVTGMENFIYAYDADSSATDVVMLARWRIAQSYENLGNTDDQLRALQELVDVFRDKHVATGSLAEEYAAQAHLTLASKDTQSFESFKIAPGAPATMKEYVTAITSQIESGAAQAKTFTGRLEPVFGYKRPRWTIAAYVKQGRLYEVLAKAVLEAPFVVPKDMNAQMKGIDRDSREDIRIQIEDQIRQVLDQKVKPIECFAVARYVLAARAARIASFDDEYSRLSIDRLQAYGDERIAQCVEEARSRDASFATYTAGEFTRAPRGEPMDLPIGSGMPSAGNEVRP